MTDEQLARLLREQQAEAQARAELRDRFAMAALTGLLAYPEEGGAPQRYSEIAYEYADAMLKARGHE